MVDWGLKYSEVEMVLVSFVDGGWFEKSWDGFYSLILRGFFEFWLWFVEIFNDLDVELNEW